MAHHAELDAQLDRPQEVSERFYSYSGDGLKKVRDKRLTRMDAMYSDLKDQSRYRQAVRFLVHDLFGTEELGNRGGELNKARPAMARMLPDTTLNTVARAVEFTALTLELDLAMADALPRAQSNGGIPDGDYRHAIRHSADKSRFEQQLVLVVDVGHEIEHMVHKPFIATALKMCRRPAASMGLSGLQDFLERGFEAFKRMKGSEAFLTTFREREQQFLDEVFGEEDGHGERGEQGA
jgi:hypothetical protein